MDTTHTARQQRADLAVAEPILAFAEEALAAEGIDAAAFWDGVSAILRDLTPRNRELLAERDRLQAQIDDYHRAHPGRPDSADYRAFLERIGYLLEQPAPFGIRTENVDAEIATLAGPQLVVPLLNARFAVNAANARWGSLYDALYGTDAIPEEGELVPGAEYNPQRGAAVIAYGRRLLDEVAPLTRGSHADAENYRVANGVLRVTVAGQDVELQDADAFVGYTGDAAEPASVLLRHHGLHLDVQIDRAGRIGATDPAGIDDIVVESALTTIMDLEDSVAAVDADDKALGYRNWQGLVTGTLTAELVKNGRSFTRRMNDDRRYTAPDGSEFALPGRSLLLVRNVGHLMTTDAITDAAGESVPEGILDAIMTAVGALPDLRGDRAGTNSRTGSLYIVKPKMHGPAEVAFTVELFSRVEDLLGLPANTLKVGIMDEERRTTLNLRAAIAEAADRIVFINTGFLDRTGDEIHTSLQAGPVVPKAAIKAQPFLGAYEDANVDAGLGAGFIGRAQIGKGMWAMPDLMHDMLEQKIAQVRSGATTAWVPSPTAATLHALHYHQVDVAEVQRTVAERPPRGIDDILIPPLQTEPLGRDAVLAEVDNNVQSILGYVVRWIDQGVGCSKVPDINGVALMEDRATLRISSQLLANWLAHGVIDAADVDRSLEKLAGVVDAQNAGDPDYEPLLDDEGHGRGIAFESARRLIVEGAAQPNGYTEPILHEMRRRKKAALAAV
ncbi:malate synthase G [Microbacterium wangruii]|uniref:malate synthase G n=1 Tax=Microbacterium wangruii TaxID=3049073 RepID=UPI00256F440F|nr:malate synthase G [Microbacterium sp. zg-Y1211]MDL5487980.1 malate synthase G [Microbacterium sp. zg-Y1211]